MIPKVDSAHNLKRDLVRMIPFIEELFKLDIFLFQERREQVKAEAIGMHSEPLPFSFSEPSFTEEPNFTSNDFEGTSKVNIYVRSLCSHRTWFGILTILEYITLHPTVPIHLL